MPIRILQIWDEPDISERMSCEVSVTFMKILQIIFSKLEKNHILSFPHISTNINLISSGVHWFWRVEFWILNIEYLLLFSAGSCGRKNQNKHSKFKIRDVQINELSRTQATKLRCLYQRKNKFMDIKQKKKVWQH